MLECFSDLSMHLCFNYLFYLFLIKKSSLLYSKLRLFEWSWQKLQNAVNEHC